METSKISVWSLYLLVSPNKSKNKHIRSYPTKKFLLNNQPIVMRQPEELEKILANGSSEGTLIMSRIYQRFA